MYFLTNIKTVYKVKTLSVLFLKDRGGKKGEYIYTISNNKIISYRLNDLT